MAAAAIFPLTMEVLLMGIVRSVSRVLFSFSEPMELMTMLPTIMMMIMMTSGIIMVWLEISVSMSEGVTPEWATPSMTVLTESPPVYIGSMM